MRPLAILSLLVLAMPAAASAAGYSTFADLASGLVNILNAGTAVLVVAGLVVYFWGISTNMFKLQKGDTTALRSHLLWGVVILFVMVSIWGIVRMLQETIFGGNLQGGTVGGSSEDVGSAFDAPPF